MKRLDYLFLRIVPEGRDEDAVREVVEGRGGADDLKEAAGREETDKRGEEYDREDETEVREEACKRGVTTDREDSGARKRDFLEELRE